jgi:hypothetical protein
MGRSPLRTAKPVHSTGGFRHVVDRHRSAAGFEHASQCSDRQYWEQYDAAIRMQEDSNSVSPFQSQMLADGLRQSDLAFGSHGGVHGNLCITFAEM